MFLRFLRAPDVCWKEDIVVGKDYLIQGEGYDLYIEDETGDRNFWALDFPNDSIQTNNEKRPHYDLRIAHANGADIEHYDCNSEEWCIVEEPMWVVDKEYRIAIPKAPERVFPVTSLTDDELITAYCQAEGQFSVDQYRAIANAAVRRYIEDMEEDTENE